MADEIIPRRKRILDSGPKKLPDINSLLKDSTKPEFLQKTDNSIFIEKEKVHGSQPATTVVNAPKSSATITKGAEIHKFPVTKDAENSNKKFQNFVDYMELRDIAGENNEDYVSMSAAVNQPEAQLGYSQRDATFGLDDPPQNMTGGLHKGSKPIRRGDKKNAVKDKEKARRMKGQSSIATWKPEAFMKMRQEFD